MGGFYELGKAVICPATGRRQYLFHPESFLHKPGSADDVAAYFESDTPFGAIAKGDLINPLGGGEEAVKQILRVVGVEHIVWDSKGEGIKHKICVFTAAEENNREARMK